jgi:ABC-type glycerol-3-phosphate transport system permease component
VDFTLMGYQAVFGNNQLGTGFINSFIYMFSGTITALVATIMAAYPLSRKEMYGRNPLMIFFTFTMMFSGGLIPTYLVVRDLGLVDSRLALIIPNALSVYYMIVARTYFQSTIPDELAEAADLDGCSDFGFIVRVVLPLSGPTDRDAVAVLRRHAMERLFRALIYLNSQSKYPLQIILRNILIMNEIDANMMVSSRRWNGRRACAKLLKFSLIVVALCRCWRFIRSCRSISSRAS